MIKDKSTKTKKSRGKFMPKLYKNILSFDRFSANFEMNFNGKSKIETVPGCILTFLL